MGRLITETKYSEITATLERLEEFGITNIGFKKIRTMSPALLRQLSHMIENDVSNQGAGFPGLCTFDIVVDSRNIDLIRKRFIQDKVFESVFVIRDVLQPAFSLPVEHKKFIALTPKDFGEHDLSTAIDKFTSKTWLKDWSWRNLLGSYYLVPCDRSDAAIHIALAMDEIKHCPRRMILICSKRDDWITIDSTGSHGHLGMKEISIGRVDFSYDCPAIFELRKS